MFEFEFEKSNISEFVGKTVIVKDAVIDDDGVYTWVRLSLDNGAEIRTASKVIAKQVWSMVKRQRLPFRAKIVFIQNDGLGYYSLANPESETSETSHKSSEKSSKK